MSHFWGLDDLLSHLSAERHAARESRREIKNIRIEAVPVAGFDSPDLRLLVDNELPEGLSFTHWSFGQLSAVSEAPASYLRRLPADITSTNLNHGLRRDGLPDTLQFLANGETRQLRSITRDYTRFWNDDLVSALGPALDRGWRVPPARPATDDPRARAATDDDILTNQADFGLSVKVGDMIAPAGVYCGDRDLFVFLVQPDRIIDDGNQGLMRGVFLWNSEVGAGSFKVRSFLLENVCGNHIVWGASDIQETRFRHRGNRILTASREMTAQLRDYADASAIVEEDMIRKSRAFVLGKDRDETVERVQGIKSIGVTRAEIEEAYQSAVHWESVAKSPPTTAWGFVHGLTRLSQREQYGDQRNRMDRAGGKLLALAAGNRSLLLTSRSGSPTTGLPIFSSRRPTKSRTHLGVRLAEVVFTPRIPATDSRSSGDTNGVYRGDRRAQGHSLGHLSRRSQGVDRGLAEEPQPKRSGATRR
jgi:hypothetical protein